MSEFDEAKFLADINMPSDEQVERAARLLSIAEHGDMNVWQSCRVEAQRALIVQMNTAKWRLGL